MNKIIDWYENGHRLTCELLFCTCSACHSYNRLDKTDLFGEPYTVHFCTLHSKEVDPTAEPCNLFK